MNYYKFSLIIALILICSFPNSTAVNAEDTNSTGSQTLEDNTFQRIEAMFGILPNPDGEINNLAFIKLNYSPNLSSSILYYSREYAKVDTDVNDDGDDIEEINSLKRRDIKLKAIEYNFNLLAKEDSFRIQMMPSINVFYYDESKISEYNITWESDTEPGTKDLYFERLRHNSSSLMPVAEAVIEFSFSNIFSLYLGGGFIPVSFDYNQFDEFGSSTEEDLALQREAYYEADYEIDFSSMGFTAKCGIKLTNLYIGSIIADFNFLYKFGDSEVKDRWWDENLQENITEYYSVVDKRTIINVDLYYQMDYLALKGMVPVLKFGYLKQMIKLDDDEEPDLSYNKFDFGIALKF